MAPTLLETPPAQITRPAPDPEALIQEARDRQWRRRRRLAAIVVVLVAATTASVVALSALHDTSSALERVPGGPTVNIAAFTHHGRLAFVSRDTVWVLDGNRRSVRDITRTPGLYPMQPSFSPDGKWLAYIETKTVPAYVAGGAPAHGQLWIAHGDGTGAHPVAGLESAELLGWSPAANVLAVAAGPISTRVPFDALTTLRLLTPEGKERVFVRARDVKGAVWSPDGRRLAIVTQSPQRIDTLAVHPLSGGAAHVWAQFRPRDHLNGMSQILVAPAGWWRGFGIGVWVFGDGMTHNNDQTPLDLITAPDARPTFLAKTLSDGTTRVVTAGRNAVAVVADVSHGINGGRIVWDAKQLQICQRSSPTCRPVVNDRSNVTLDPAWSPGGDLLAFVEAPDLSSSGWQQATLTRWHREHALRLFDLRTDRLRTVTAARGATAPVWSADGKSLLYVADDGIWLLPTPASAPVEIATPLFARSSWPSYYGQIAWPSQFAWWSA
jgi:dipeptidyl aminopeptidase/acylaminoacyl peptidase